MPTLFERAISSLHKRYLLDTLFRCVATRRRISVSIWRMFVRRKSLSPEFSRTDGNCIPSDDNDNRVRAARSDAPIRNGYADLFVTFDVPDSYILTKLRYDRFDGLLPIASKANVNYGARVPREMRTPSFLAWDIYVGTRTFPNLRYRIGTFYESARWTPMINDRRCSSRDAAGHEIVISALSYHRGGTVADVPDQPSLRLWNITKHVSFQIENSWINKVRVKEIVKCNSIEFFKNIFLLRKNMCS